MAIGQFIGNYGTLMIDSNGAWNYILDSSAGSATDRLKGGEVAHDYFTVYSMDGSASKTIDITVTGENDVPVIGGVSQGLVIEDNASGAVTQVGDTLTIVDADAGESYFQVPTNLSGVYGHFTFTENGTWTYELDNSVGSETDKLAEGQEVHDQLTVYSADGTASTVIDVTVFGSNDQPEIGGIYTGAVQEDNNGGVISVSGFLLISDPDAGENFFRVDNVEVGQPGEPPMPSFAEVLTHDQLFVDHAAHDTGSADLSGQFNCASNLLQIGLPPIRVEHVE